MVRERLGRVRTRLSALPSDQGGIPPQPEATPEEWEQYARLLHLLGNAYENHLDSLNALGHIRQSRQELQAKSGAWQGFSEPGPHSVDFVDNLWMEVRAKEREIEATRLEQAALESVLENQRLALKNSEQALRRVKEELESADPLQADRLRWLLDLSETRNLHDQARMTALDSEREFRAETLAYRLEERDLLRRQALAASRVSPVSMEDRDAKVGELSHFQQALEEDILRAAEASRTAQERLHLARERLREAQERRLAEGQEMPIERPQRELDTLKTEVETSGSSLKVLRLLALVLVVQRQMWDQRYRIEHAPDSEALDGVLVEIQQNADRLTALRKYLRSDLETTQRRMSGLEKRLADWKSEYGDRDLGEREQMAYTRQQAVVRRALAEADDLDAALRSLRESVRLREENATVPERLRRFAGDVEELVEKVWDFELLTVEDKIVAEGREIVGKRSVTMGKVLQVLLILGLGLWFTTWLAEHGRRLLTRRLPGRESAALLGLRLFTLLAVVGLVVFALITVNIPLTVFAFMGGALAIGVGFGAQNILNNFISGLILLVEKPIKLGDIVDIDGVRGRVTHIGSRCCQVHRFDGIDMLIPNSSFLEKNVTNWTLSDATMRFSLTVDAAYGSPIRDAMAVLKRAIEEHPRILNYPAAEVYLEEFGDSALIFRADYWIDVRVEPNWLRVASDLRIRVEELFDELGIVISFPQRDVHLHSAKPMKVELVAAGSIGRAGESSAGTVKS